MARAVLAVSLLAVACGPGPVGPPGQHVLLVTLDTVRADRLSCYGHPHIETPALEALAREGTVFEQAFTPIPSTLPAHVSIMTALYPASSGVHDNGVYVLEDEVLTLAERLQAQGFSTAAFVSAFVLDRRFGLDQGFDHYDDEMEDPILLGGEASGASERTEEESWWHGRMRSKAQRRGERITEQALQWLGARGPEPFFLWVHYYDAHVPYDAPESWATHYDPDYLGPIDGHPASWWRAVIQAGGQGRNRLEPHHEHMVARYEGEISYLDSQLGRLFAGMQRAGVWEDTFVVVVADHGESFGEHGRQFWEHNQSIFDEVMRVPFILRRPDRVGAGRRVARLVRTLDVAPTVLDWLELPPFEGVQGQSLLPLTRDPKAPAPEEILLEAGRERQVRPTPRSFLGLRTSRQKIVLTLDPQGRVVDREFYGLRRDPAERNPSKQRGRKLAARALAEYERLARGRTGIVRELDDETKDGLRALGYLEE